MEKQFGMYKFIAIYFFCGLLGMSLITGLDMYPKLNRAMTYKAPTQQLCTVKDRDPAR